METDTKATKAAPPAVAASPHRVVVDGKFFRFGAKKLYAKGVTYGPFAPDALGSRFATPEQTAKDFELIRQMEANVLRVYHAPPRWFLDLAAKHDLFVLVDVPWDSRSCFLDTEAGRNQALAAVREAATACKGHPALFAISVVNEVPSDVVRWSGADRVAEFIDELAMAAKVIDPDCLCTFGNFPPTEFLRPQNLDFLCFNVYLHQQRSFDNYLARLQMIADAKPLVLGEFGMDSIREGEEAKSEFLAWQIETLFRGGLAGGFVYSFTDDWFKDGYQITDWAFGVTTADRQPKPAFETVRKHYAIAPHFPLPNVPRVSVVVASYNGARTLHACLDSLGRLNYPNYEVILVDDGSKDDTVQIASHYPNIRYIRHERNAGLSVARNTGIHAADGEVVAFTDSDCRADEDWLYYLIGDLLRGRFVGIGGHNFLPPEDSPVAAAVMASPGGPAHVMITDRIAEHVPGCNMAFYRWALLEINGFDPIFWKAGDDVDICWRLQQRGYRLGFTPAGFVWHYRRSTVHAYLKQQQGYGEAEALLMRKHPEYFNTLGGSIWHGRIYASAQMGVTTRRPIIYHGLFGSSPFQTLYSPPPEHALMFLTSLEYHALVTLPLLVMGVVIRQLIPLGAASLVISILLCFVAGWQALLPPGKRRRWSRPLIALLYFSQPIIRGWARYQGQLSLNPAPLVGKESLEQLSLKHKDNQFGELRYRSWSWFDRMTVLGRILERFDQFGWPNKVDEGWKGYDVEIYGSRWCTLQMTTAVERSEGYVLRIRLKPSWSFMASLCFWSLLGFELVVLGFVQGDIPQLWLLLLTVPLFAWWLNVQKQGLQRLTATFLDGVADELKLERLPFESPKK